MADDWLLIAACVIFALAMIVNAVLWYRVLRALTKPPEPPATFEIREYGSRCIHGAPLGPGDVCKECAKIKAQFPYVKR